MRHVRGVLERVAVVQHQVGHFAVLDTPETVVDAQQFGRVQRDGAQGAVKAQAVHRRHRRLVAQDALLWHVSLKGGAQADGHLLVRQRGGVAQAAVERLHRRGPLHRRVDDHRHLVTGELVGDQVALGRQAQHGFQLVFLGEPQGPLAVPRLRHSDLRLTSQESLHLRSKHLVIVRDQNSHRHHHKEIGFRGRGGKVGES